MLCSLLQHHRQKQADWNFLLTKKTTLLKECANYCIKNSNAQTMESATEVSMLAKQGERNRNRQVSFISNCVHFQVIECSVFTRYFLPGTFTHALCFSLHKFLQLVSKRGAHCIGESRKFEDVSECGFDWLHEFCTCTSTSKAFQRNGTIRSTNTLLTLFSTYAIKV